MTDKNTVTECRGFPSALKHCIKLFSCRARFRLVGCIDVYLFNFLRFRDYQFVFSLQLFGRITQCKGQHNETTLSNLNLLTVLRIVETIHNNVRELRRQSCFTFSLRT